MTVIPLPARADAFWSSLRTELASRARIVVAGSRQRRLSADDLVQETVAKLLASYGEEALRERSPEQLLSLAWRTMSNLVIDAGRRKAEVLDPGRADQSSSLPEPVDPARPTDESLHQQQRDARVRDALGRLADDERCFLVHVLETDSVPAAQRHCNWPPKSPYYVLRKLLDRLRGELGEGL